MLDDADGGAHEDLIAFLYRAPVGLMQMQADGSIDMLNPMAAQLLLPVSPDGQLANLFDVLADRAPGLRRQCAAFTGRQGVICDAMRIRIGDGAARPGATSMLSVSLLKSDDGALMAVLLDASSAVQREKRSLQRGLDSGARTDPLTRLPNRAALRERLAHVAQRTDAAGGAFAVLFINADRFHQINATYGNGAGDEVIGVAAGRLRAALRAGARDDAAIVPPDDGPGAVIDARARDAASGELVARVGGDEFAVVLTGLRAAGDAAHIAARLLRVLGAPYRVGAHAITCTFSIGVVPQAQAADDADAILGDASVAMAVAKARGGAQLATFEPAMRERAAQRGGIEAELRTAIAEQQLFVVYQPVVGIVPGGGIDRAAGVEALVRWRHPQRGIVPPVEFIGIAEECGLIGAIGEHVLRVACADFMRWHAALGAQAPRLLAVNLSRAQLAQATLADTVDAILRAAGMPPSALQLEITESLAAQGETMHAQLQQLKSLGVTLALDDFGTGYSSLSSLHLLPVDTVKIDRSFVSLADTSAHHQVLIDATVKVARSLGMRTVAEGIETAAQADVVRRLGCDKAQGYLYSKPVTADAVIAWVTAPQ